MALETNIAGTSGSEGLSLLGEPAVDANCVNCGITQGVGGSGMVSAEKGLGGVVYERVHSRKRERLGLSLAEGDETMGVWRRVVGRVGVWGGRRGDAKTKNGTKMAVHVGLEVVGFNRRW